jgi:putative DNA methylase
MTYRKKLIEVALPLNIIAEAAVREKSIRHGHPSTLHLWWSRKPLAACRAVLFASLVDDPSEHPEQFPTERDQEQERDRLFGLMQGLVTWENSNNQEVWAKVQAEIRKSTGNQPPVLLDPFCGGGSIPLEGQRLGLEAHGSDLNPVAVLISKALIEIPPRFANHRPINPEAKLSLLGDAWAGAHGLAADIRYYGQWMRNEAEKRIGQFYPKVTLPREQGEGEASVIAWLWVRTVTCPNPACSAQMPLTSKWWLSKKKGKETWANPHVDYSVMPPTVNFTVQTGQGEPQDGTVNRQGAKCLACGSSVPFEHVRNEGKAGRMGAQLMAIVAEGSKGRVYLAPNTIHMAAAAIAFPVNAPESLLPEQALGFRIQAYGMLKHRDLFTSRQLTALITFSDLVHEARERVLADANRAGMPADGVALRDGGKGAQAYSEAVATYLALALDKGADYWSAICSWHAGRDTIRNTFARQAISMVWDFAEANPLSESTGNFLGAVNWVVEVIESASCNVPGSVKQRDATTSNGLTNILISTDPPYYDNIGYADLSDFFYVWLRRSLIGIYPELFSTMLVPKTPELIAAPYRFGGSKSKAQEFFETGLEEAFRHMRAVHNPKYPMTVYYAFKQAETEEETDIDDDSAAKPASGNGKGTTASTGWETMLEGLIRSGFTITGTWPMHTELANRTRGQNSNALASSIVLVCRPRPVDAEVISQREFLRALRAELPRAMREIQHGNVAAVDFEQACIGPGMAIFSRYSRIEDAEGKAMRVRTALQFINRTKDEILAEQEGEYDAPTQWAVKWFEQYAMNAGPYGEAETLSKARNTGVASLEAVGLVESRAGKVRLRTRAELPPMENLSGRTNLTTWEVTQRMIYELDLENKAGKTEEGAARILRQASEIGDLARDLAYRLYTICERKGWTQEAMSYNNLVASWSEIARLAVREVVEVKQSAMWSN